ncbi:MAG: acetylxylan esterase [Verrucomicrobia bacterium]|nr:acetylxylan esterase [Verrucomicrobiota bacterium]MDA1068865.1 acetylxylan esterase [Verrucomicrobiota bacterium]
MKVLQKTLRRILVGLIFVLTSISTLAAGPKVLPEGESPSDARLGELKDLDGYFPFTPPASKEDWDKRSGKVRRQLLVANGLWPMPTRTPLVPVVHGLVSRHGYTVEKVFFQSHPGFYVTGSLYRPANPKKKMPGILCPHGHWRDARFYDKGIEEVRKEIVIGSERFEEGGRNQYQARCVQLARMGCVVFQYDMIGHSDSLQISHDRAHKFAEQVPEMNTETNWGLFSPQAEGALQSVMGLHTWNSIRALDFLLTLPEVDPDRLAITGASGGGTQTFMLAALDDRIDLAVPAVMVSTGMQGGCTCENASLLRIDTGNVEFAALFGPKPLGLTAADDWTIEMETKGFPELKAHYKLLGAADKVALWANTHFKHNYNYVNRAAMYSWVNKHFKLGYQDPIVEPDYRRLTHAETTVWDEIHPQPEGGSEFERKLLATIHQDSQQQIAKARQTPDEYRRLVGGALETIIGRTLDSTGNTDFEWSKKMDRGDYLEMPGLLRNNTYGEELPVVFLYPKKWNGTTTVWIDKNGKSALFENKGAGYQPNENVRKLLTAGSTVVGVDLLYQGEFLANGPSLELARKVENPREFAGYTHGYNHSLFAQRVHDILSLIDFVNDHERKSESINLIGLAGAGHWVAAARAVSGDVVTHAAIDTDGFRFVKLKDIRDTDFLPGGIKYDDLPGMIAVSAPAKLWLSGESDEGKKFVNATYQYLNAADNISIGNSDAKKAVDWLLK